MSENEFDSPLSRNEAILQNILGASNELGNPLSREEKLLMKLIGKQLPDSSDASDGDILTADGHGGCEWREPSDGLPPGGVSGQILTKKSEEDGDADWEDIHVAPIDGRLTLLASNWIADQTIENTFIQEITIPESNTNSNVDIVYSADVVNKMIAMEIKSLYIANDNGDLFAVAVGAQPTEDITIDYKMTIVVSAGTSGLVTNINDIIQNTGDEVILNGGTSTGPSEDVYPNANGESF